MLINISTVRLLSFIEGISFLLILFIGMPLKYGLGIREVNYILGLSHGLLTIVFCFILFIAWIQKIISTRLCFVVFMASLVPFGAFFAEIKLKHSRGI